MKSIVEYIQINEDGIYKGCEELSKYISKRIENSDDNLIIINRNELDMPNIFFDTIYIDISYNITEDIDKASYIINNDVLVADLIRWNYEKECFNYIEFNIHLVNNRKADYKKIAHELNHAYEDYKTRKNHKNLKTLSNYLNKKYYKATELFSNTNLSEKIVGFIEYVSTGTETRAHVAQAMIGLKENIKKYKSFDDALKYQLEHNEVFITFAEYKNLFINKSKGKFTMPLICKAYRKIYPKSNEQDQTIIKKLEFKFNEYERALMKHIKTIFDNYAKENA